MIKIAILVMFALQPSGDIIYRPVVHLDNCKEETVEPYVSKTRKAILNHFGDEPVLPTFGYICEEVDHPLPNKMSKPV